MKLKFKQKTEMLLFLLIKQTLPYNNLLIKNKTVSL